MKELLEKLRSAAQVAYDSDLGLYIDQQDCAEAADLIERMRDALKKVKREFDSGHVNSKLGEIVNSALTSPRT